jgi:hypothetical protein
MGGTPPTPEEIARWLLSAATAQDTPEELTMAAIQAYEQLRVHLATFLGPQGFDALWIRALHLVRRSFSWEHTAVPSAVAPAAHLIDLAVRGRDTAEAHAVLLAIFSQFFTLLFTFIGANLAFRLLRQRWPALPVATVGAPDAEELP